MMLSEETSVPRSVVFSDADRCAQAIVGRVGHDLRLAVPMSIGKPILIVDESITPVCRIAYRCGSISSFSVNKLQPAGRAADVDIDIMVAPKHSSGR
jgi:hypothetical protein